MALASLRTEFPVSGRYIYLDHAGVAPVSGRVRAAVERFIAESAGSGAFTYPEWAKQISETRSLAAQLLNAETSEIAFVRSTSHGLSLVAEGLPWNTGENVVVYEKEFPANLFPWLHLERKGVEARIVRARNGRVEIDDIASAIDEKTRLIALSSVQFTTGFRVDLEKLGGICRSKGVLLCVDAIQSLGLIPADVQRCCIDFLAADAHKWLMGPEGIGIFYCRKGLAEQLEPPLVGWKSVMNEFAFETPVFDLKTDAQRFEEGSLNLMGIIGLGAAIGLLLEAGIERIERRVLDLGDLIIQEADARNFSVLSPRDRRERGGIVTVAGTFDPVGVREGLRKKGIMVNTRAGGIRISPHFYNTEEEIRDCFRTIDQLTAERSC
jgi:selenocysteine lyase/cysteine desulfurase